MPRGVSNRLRWTDEDIETAKRLWRGGMTALQVSEEMDFRYSRNAILGKMTRLGFSRNGKKIIPKPKRVPVPKPLPIPLEEREAYCVDRVWSLPEDDRRASFYRRAKAGAKAAISEINRMEMK